MKLAALLAAVTIGYLGLIHLAGVAVDRFIPESSLHSFNLDGRG